MAKTMRVFFICLLSLYHSITCFDFNDHIEWWMSYLPSKLDSCSEYFQYQRIDEYINGKLQLPNIKMGDTVKIAFYRLDNNRFPAFNGIFLPDESSETVLDKIQNAQSITYRVDFPITNGVPELINIFINDKELCTTKYNRSADTKVHVFQHTMRPANGSLSVFTYNIHIPHFKNPINTKHLAESSTCGVTDAEIRNSGVTPLVYGGSEINRGEYPWLTAIYKNDKNDLLFLCGGSLVTSKIILTAAHCFQGTALNAENIIAVLGQYNLTNYAEDGYVKNEIKALTLHPEYKLVLGYSDADLALLEMKNHVSFTKFIKPICLWSEPEDETLVVNRNGVVVGWGSDEYGNTISEVPKQVNINIESEAACLRSSLAFTSITTSRTLCAGNRDGSGPCDGDSGGGLMIKQYGRWLLRGVVSAGLTLERRCNLREYTVYCDIAKHKSWLEKYVGNQKSILSSIEDICGRSGAKSRSEHPWFAAIYIKKFTGELFWYTGLLISSRSVLTRAFSFVLTDGTKYSSDTIKIYLGRYDLKNMQENEVQTRNAATLIFHPDFKYSVRPPRNNLLLIQMEAPVSFTEYVKPICLWSAIKDGNSSIFGESAIVASWDLPGVLDDTLTVPTFLKVNVDECGLQNYAPNKSRVSSVLCVPRIENKYGAILMLKRNERWVLRGINMLLSEYDTFESKDLFLYTDIVEFLSWIHRNMLL